MLGVRGSHLRVVKNQPHIPLDSKFLSLLYWKYRENFPDLAKGKIMSNSSVKFPEVHVKLTGTDGNAFAVMGAVIKAMKRAGCSADDVSEYQSDAMSGDYNHLLQVSMLTVEVN